MLDLTFLIGFFECIDGEEAWMLLQSFGFGVAGSLTRALIRAFSFFLRFGLRRRLVGTACDNFSSSID